HMVRNIVGSLLEVGAHNQPESWIAELLAARDRTLAAATAKAEVLKQQGYDTAMMGKLHLNAGGDRTDQPQAKDMGFDYTLVNPAG
ncbi:hypothetical protein MJM45_29725, partial [Salmonella enterica subsp. enterica serovar Kentucky]|nr:hypothetical protein [Salmonella enterica subsp. enterica serovar Kentucky]